MGSTLAFYSGSIALGLALGVTFVACWRICMPRGATGRVISDLIAIARDMTRADEVDNFLTLYKRLIVSVGGYLARNIGGLVLACVPMALVLTLLAPPALEAWGRRVDGIAVYPQLTTTASVEDQASKAEEEAESGLTLTIGDTVVLVPTPHGRTAICWIEAYCMLFGLLGFEVRETPDALLADASYIVFRPDHGDRNFIWPFLGDLEFAFLVTFMLAMLGALLLPRRQR